MRMNAHRLWIEDGEFKCGLLSREVHIHYGRDRLLGPRSGGETLVRDGLSAIDVACQGGRRVSACQSAQIFSASRGSRRRTR